MTHNYVVTSHKPSEVTRSVVAGFTGPDDVNLIIAKGNRLIIELVGTEGLQGIHEFPLYGRIAALEAYHLRGESQDCLFVLTERCDFCVLQYDSKNKEIRTRAVGYVGDRIGRAPDNGKLCFMDPQNRVIGLYLYEGLLKVIPIDAVGNLKESFNIRLDEMVVLHIVFLHGCSKPTIAMLYKDQKGLRYLKTYVMNIKDKELSTGPWRQVSVEAAATLLVAVPEPFGGVMVMGEQSITYLNGAIMKTVPIGPTTITAVGRLEPSGTRYLVGDLRGEIHVIVMSPDADGNAVETMHMEPVGITSSVSCISYLDNSIAFVGSRCGDSHLIRLTDEPLPGGSHVEVLETYESLGPIVDMCMVDMDRQGQAQAVTCSGLGKDGSLRVVTNSIDIKEQASIEMQGIKGMWSLRPSSSAEHDKYLVQAFITETRVLAIEGDEMSEETIAGFLPGRTIYTGNVAGDLIVQVTKEGAALLKSASMERIMTWTPPHGHVTIASSNARQVVIACAGGNLYHLEVKVDQSSGGGRLTEVSHAKLEHEIACLGVNPPANTARNVDGMVIDSEDDEDVTRAACSTELSSYVAVGVWTDMTARLLSLPDLKEVARRTLDSDTQARSVLLVTLCYEHYMLVGLGDGVLVSYPIEIGLDRSKPIIGTPKRVMLGTQPIGLGCFESGGAACVFVTGNRPTVVYGRDTKVLYANVNVGEVSSACTFHSEPFPECLAFANDSTLMIGTIDSIQKLHIRTVQLGEQPKCIAHHESGRLFGVCSTRSDNEPETSFVHFLDDTSFDEIMCFPLDPCEMGISIGHVPFTNARRPMIVVGTAYINEGEYEPSLGRLLVFGVEGDGAERKVHLMAEMELPGAGYSVSAYKGQMIATCNSSVLLIDYMEKETGASELETKSHFTGHILALYLKTRGDYILIGDLMRSMSLLTVNKDGKLDEIARDYNSNWMTAVEIMEDDVFLGAENDGNLFTIRKNPAPTSDEEMSRLDLVGEFHVGEFINVIVEGSLVMQPSGADAISSVGRSTRMFGTVSGMLGCIITITEEAFMFFHRMQSAMARVVRGVGGLDHKKWRSFSTERRTSESHNFVDGDLIESFLDLSREYQDKVVRLMVDEMAAQEGIFEGDESTGAEPATAPLPPLSTEDVIRRVEEMTRMH